ncbi:MAG: GNAT family N-acetyltransferase [Oscillospiraceae bacterium]|nr:GNAT family N-acetyltransferase [Oscillospiraceae bacterium]
MSIKIKQAQETDIPVIEDILSDTINWLNEMGQPIWSKETTTWNALSKYYRIDDFFIAYLNDKPAGCVVIIDFDPFFFPDIPKGKSLFIHKLAVKKFARKSGVSDTLLDYIKDRGIACGVQSIQLETHALRPKLRAFYERHGFEFQGIRKFDSGIQSAYYKFALKE